MSVRIGLDTNAYSDLARGTRWIDAVQEAREVWMPVNVLAELRAGFLCGSQSRQNERNLQRFLDSSRVTVTYPDEATTHLYARLYRQLRKQGTPIPINDLWIAALVLQHDLVFCTSDAHFQHLPQIPRWDD